MKLQSKAPTGIGAAHSSEVSNFVAGLPIHCNAGAKLATTDLCKDEVKRRLESYEDDGVTDELYGFGTMLVHDAVDRLSKINGTAGATAAYCAGLITILTSTATIWGKGIGP